MLSWERSRKQGVIDSRIPVPTLNYNIDPTIRYSDYLNTFTNDACLKELPALLRIANYDDKSDNFTMLDYGCGLGRLAYAFTERFGDDASRSYYGHEVHPDAFAFLVNGYQGYDNVRFLTDPIDLVESYVELGQGSVTDSAELERVNPDSVSLRPKLFHRVDLQFSHSVFTHMRRAPIVHVLREFLSVLSEGGVCANTWLVIDDFAIDALASGQADRDLPYEIDGFRTYSTTNPLVCTAYPIQTVQEIYRDAGHEILSIEFGTWSGRKPTQTFTYQDVVISRASTVDHP